MAYFDRFDVAEAYYCYAADHHGGAGSLLYAVLSRMSEYFKPRHTLSVDTLTENGREIYDALVDGSRAVRDRRYTPRRSVKSADFQQYAAMTAACVLCGEPERSDSPLGVFAIGGIADDGPATAIVAHRECATGYESSRAN